MAAITSSDIAGYVRALVRVYSALIIIHIVISIVFSLGGRIPYARWSNAVITFLRDVCEPYLAIFRRIIPPFGAIDFSPILALIALSFVGELVARAIERI